MEPLITFLSGLRWQDIVDILLNSFILFRLYVLFRGTNVIRMIMALAMLWMVERLAVNMGLIVTSWAMQGIITAAALIIIIVFRNEIASVLQTRNLKSFFWGIPRPEISTPHDIIVESIYELARRKLGALVVLPLNKGLEPLVQSGIAWEGKLSREMLVSIFWEDNPVHDGAVIIQGDRVVEVASILPLSKRSDLPTYFGTRHRAAAGLAEQTDAMVIVVSEERGQVSVFKNNAVVHIHDNNELSLLLREHAGETVDTPGLKKQTLELGLVGLICLVSITTVWFSFARGMESLINLEVPVEFMNRDPQMEIFDVSASSVKLQLAGSGALLKALHPNQVKVKLNLANANPGRNQLAVSGDAISLPPGIQLKQVTPQMLVVAVDKPTEKVLPVQADWSGKLDPELIMESARLTPSTVTVIGAGLTLKSIETIYTEQIPLDGIGAGGQRSVGLVLQPASLKLKNDDKTRATVTFKVRPRNQ